MFQILEQWYTCQGELHRESEAQEREVCYSHKAESAG